MNKYYLNLFSENNKDLENFLSSFYNDNIQIKELNYETSFDNPVDMIEIISTLVDNNEKYPIGIWISIDSNIFIRITDLNLNKIIRYLFERYPY